LKIRAQKILFLSVGFRRLSSVVCLLRSARSNAQGGAKLSNIFNRFYTFFALFHTFFQIFLQLLTVFNRFRTRTLVRRSSLAKADARLVRKIEQGRPNNSSKLSINLRWKASYYKQA
jgi:hypothetical protein